MERFEIEPVTRPAVRAAAEFLSKWRRNPAQESSADKPAYESGPSIERRLNWLLVENPLTTESTPLGYCVRDELGMIRGLNLCYPSAYVAADKRLVGLCSGSYFVEPPARSLGFFLFKKYLRITGYSFYFATTCNSISGKLWTTLRGNPVPHSETEYIVPLRLDAVLPAYVASRTSSRMATGMARLCGRGADPILQWWTRPSAKLAIEPCQDWGKLSTLFHRHRAPDHITSDRSPALLQWRYGNASPAHPCGVYLFRDHRGNEGWFAVGRLTARDGGHLREAVLLDVVWPRDRMNFKPIFQEICRLTARSSDVMLARWQPGLDYCQYGPHVIAHKLAAPRAFVIVPKGAERLPLASFDYDDSDYIAWRFPGILGR